MWILTQDKRAINMDCLESLVVTDTGVESDHQFQVIANDRWASKFLVWAFSTRIDAENFINSTTARANASPSDSTKRFR